MNTFEAEILYDLTWNFAKEDASFIESFSDSRERFTVLMDWTREFSKLHENADWATLDYLETVDAFYDEKVKGLK